MLDDNSGVYHTCTPVVEKHFDPESGPHLPETIVNALAEATDIHPTDLPPLYRVVDLDALSALFSPERADTRSAYAFEYKDWEVIINNSQVRVCDQSIETKPMSVFEDATD